jgi:hypothetical protein
VDLVHESTLFPNARADRCQHQGRTLPPFRAPGSTRKEIVPTTTGTIGCHGQSRCDPPTRRRSRTRSLGSKHCQPDNSVDIVCRALPAGAQNHIACGRLHPPDAAPRVVSVCMCRNITILRGLEPAATGDEIEAAARQYVRKVAGLQTVSRNSSDAFDEAVRRVAEATAALLESLPPRQRPPKTSPPLRRIHAVS